jgi:hypothetical protein
MVEPYRSPSRPRHGLLAVVMLGVLLAATALAWWFSGRANRSTSAAVELMAEIRHKGLGAYWGQRPEQTWWLVYGSGPNPLGWATRIRQPAGPDADEFVGDHQYVVPDRAAINERWRLSRDLSKGTYIGTAVLGARRETLRTQIDLDNGQIQIEQTVRQGPASNRRQVRSPAPPSYIPEGLMELVIAQVASADRDMVFRMIIDDESIGPRGVNFTVARMSPGGDGSEVSVDTPGENGRKSYRLDKQGRIELITQPDGIQERRVPLEEVLQYFPTASSYQHEEVESAAPGGPEGV